MVLAWTSPLAGKRGHYGVLGTGLRVRVQTLAVARVPLLMPGVAHDFLIGPDQFSPNFSPLLVS
jgi:hypothetical protein